MTAVKLPSEPVLDGVAEEDRPTVRNIIYMLYTLRLCVSWSVTPKDRWYEVVGLAEQKPSVEFGLHELDLIKRVDLLRVHHVAVRTGQPASVVVLVLRKSEPVVLEEQDVVIHIQRKRRFGA